jgi:hypothetical protein
MRLSALSRWFRASVWRLIGVVTWNCPKSPIPFRFDTRHLSHSTYRTIIARHLLLSIDRFMIMCRALTNMVGNGVATK